jgi:hypothetical protein
VRERLRGPDDALVHHLDRCRHYPPSDDVGHGLGAGFHGGEVEQQGPDGGWPRQDAHAHARHDAQRAFAADHDATQVVPGGLGPLGADARLRAVGEHHVEREDVRAGDAVSQAVRTAGVRVDVAADRGRLLTRRIGRVREPHRCERHRQVEVRQAWFHPREAVLGPDLEDARHLAGDDHERIACRCGGPRQPGAGSAGHDGQPVCTRDANARPDVLGGEGERDERTSAFHHRGVARVQTQGKGVGEHAAGVERSDQVAACGFDVGHAAQRSRVCEVRRRR